MVIHGAVRDTEELKEVPIGTLALAAGRPEGRTYPLTSPGPGFFREILFWQTRTGFLSCPRPRAAAKAADEVLLLEGQQGGPAVRADPGGLALEEGIQKGLALAPGQGVPRLHRRQAGQASQKLREAFPLSP